MSDESPIRIMLRQEQSWRLRDAKIGAQRLVELSNQLIKKIEADGYYGYYSINHDVLASARKVHTACNDLWRLRVLNEKLDEVEKNTPKIVTPEPEPAVQKKSQPKSKCRKKKS